MEDLPLNPLLGETLKARDTVPCNVYPFVALPLSPRGLDLNCVASGLAVLEIWRDTHIHKLGVEYNTISYQRLEKTGGETFN